MINHISIISIPVSDQGRAKSFYMDTLGFDLVIDNQTETIRWIQLVPPGGGTSISLTTWLDDYPPGTVRGNLLEVDDLATTKQELNSRGLTFTGDDQHTPWGIFAAFEDPDGNRWSMHEPADSGY